jgi:uncharacterized protein (TIGR00369 family)
MNLFGAEIPFAGHCSIEPIAFDGERTRMRVALRREHTNHFGIAHGGILCTLLDIAMGTAARCNVGRPVMTLDMQVSFLSPGRGEIIAEGRVLRAGRSIVFCEAEARTSTGELVAKSSGIFKAVSENHDSLPQNRTNSSSSASR